ncbi:hypothetical protein [Vulcanisaeta souniana]|uniref:Nucleotidyltransferase n=1 Tax=Vulcanisaeta souniana JCM 11219 TaxID=1293586 RepID=A0A830E6A9_9CREN|nr:hypothetical protein [Vulcanisaeta souniana]BDR91576.1 hypothetical protein Vsou_06690 [Vulcanisaeta souniana JCM 11219]GGI74299.1 hypothetical protein GCM10007112_08850 [Vulcanisaeta souniana JCM 11219]
MCNARSIFDRRGIRRLPPDRVKERLEMIIDLSRAIARRDHVRITNDHMIVNDWSLFTRYLINCIDNNCALMSIRVDGGQGNSLLNFLARINDRLESEGVGRVIIVGGFAAELYSGGVYRTGDVDVIIDSRDPKRAMDILHEELRSINARREGRVWVSDYFGVLTLDVVGVTYVGRIKVLRVGDGHVYVESPEDNVITSLNACVYLSSDADCEGAAAVLAAQWSNVDWDYLIDRARHEDVLDKLNEIKRVIEDRYGKNQER